MSFKMDDVTAADGAAIAAMASDPRFFYVYINNGGRDPVEAGHEYAGLCHLALDHRMNNQPLPDELPWQKAFAKGLRDQDGKLAGVVVLLHEKNGETEIGYFLHPDFHGKGLGIRMAMSVVKWACENTDLQTLKGDVDPANEASKKMLAKMGLDVAEYHETGSYSDRDGTLLPSMIMKGSREQVEAALQNYLHHHKDQLFDIQDAVIDTRKKEDAPAHKTSNKNPKQTPHQP